MIYTVQRFGSWEWLMLDAPLTTDGPEFALSSWGVMSASITPELAAAVDEGGRLLFEEWGTLVHVETGDSVDRRRWSGVVARSQVKGAAHELRIVELPGYSDGIPVDALVRGTGTDPAQLIREVWQAVQAHGNSWLNIDVVGATPVRLGTDLDDKVAIARAVMDARKSTLDSLQANKAEANAGLQDATRTLGDEVAAARAQVVQAQNALTALFSADAPQAQIDDAQALLTSRQGTLATVDAAFRAETAAGRAALASAATTVDAARAAHDAAREAYQAAQELAREKGGAYEIRPEDLTDAAKAIDAIVTTGGVEWTTRTDYSATVPQVYVDIHFPAAGRLRDDLVFEQGANIVSNLDPVRDGAEYANAAYGIGAGEGADSVRATIENASPRLRRPVVVEDRTLQRADQLIAATRAELARRTGEPFVKSIEVIDHPNAPIGSWSVGDTITVRGTVPHLGEYARKHRVISWRYLGETRAELRLEPAAT